ncbi:MAG: nicotinate-nucleotide--dimethylbenzimidazole phosphoribosyltransferase [Bacteroidales bacterium]|nr:nicotinate-nucleotide--dimethylbenzimidazole phosphoribosyltransferase [Bacteroidales bacterium]
MTSEDLNIQFHIKQPDQALRAALQAKIDNLTKPKGSLGRLESLALQIGLIQQTLTPELRNPQNILFAGDHGIAEEGVSVAPREVTWQQVCHFTHPQGTGGVNFLCRQHGFKLKVVDAGVDYDLPKDRGIIDFKIRRGTSNFLYGAAMSEAEMERCLECGARVVEQCAAKGSNVLSFGEMGIGNTSPSSVWMSYFTGIPIEKCIGAGSGLDSAGIRHKCDVLKRAMENYSGSGSAADIIRWFGGFEMVMAVGAMLKAAEMGIIIMVDGFIMTSCMLAASQLYPAVKDYAIFGHCGDESGHKLMIEAMEAKPLLNLGLRLGEGTGAICAYPIVQSAVNMINQMDTFQGADITKYF